MYSEVIFTTKNWSDLCNFYSKAIFFLEILYLYSFLFFAELGLLMLHNNIVKISEKNVQPFENLPPSLHSFLLWEKCGKSDTDLIVLKRND